MSQHLLTSRTNLKKLINYTSLIQTRVEINFINKLDYMIKFCFFSYRTSWNVFMNYLINLITYLFFFIYNSHQNLINLLFSHIITISNVVEWVYMVSSSNILPPSLIMRVPFLLVRSSPSKLIILAAKSISELIPTCLPLL